MKLARGFSGAESSPSTSSSASAFRLKILSIFRGGEYQVDNSIQSGEFLWEQDVLNLSLDLGVIQGFFQLEEAKERFHAENPNVPRKPGSPDLSLEFRCFLGADDDQDGNVFRSQCRVEGRPACDIPKSDLRPMLYDVELLDSTKIARPPGIRQSPSYPSLLWLR